MRSVADLRRDLHEAKRDVAHAEALRTAGLEQARVAEQRLEIAWQRHIVAWVNLRRAEKARAATE